MLLLPDESRRDRTGAPLQDRLGGQEVLAAALWADQLPARTTD
jgi:hypothetical protein